MCGEGCLLLDLIVVVEYVDVYNMVVSCCFVDVYVDEVFVGVIL